MGNPRYKVIAYHQPDGEKQFEMDMNCSYPKVVRAINEGLVKDPTLDFEIWRFLASKRIKWYSDKGVK